MAKEASGDGSSPLLERLERLVHQATEEIGALRATNTELREQVATLEQERDADRGTASDWQQQREEIESRLDGLVSGLEGLLTD